MSDAPDPAAGATGEVATSRTDSARTDSPRADSPRADSPRADSPRADARGGPSTRPGDAGDGKAGKPDRPGEPGKTVVVVGPDGQPVGAVEVGGSEPGEEEDPTRQIGQPAKVMRIGSMIKQLLEEVKSAPLDEKARARLTSIHRQSIRELESGLSPELVAELDRLALPFEDGETPTEAELRIAQAQLVGWLEGLFHGIQAVLVAQQMAARIQLEQMRAGRPALPPGSPGMPGMPGMPGRPSGEEPTEGGRTGQYL